MKEFLSHPIDIARRVLSIPRWRLMNFLKSSHRLFATVIRLQSLVSQQGEIERHQRDQLAVLREEKEALQKLASTIADKVAVNSAKNGKAIDFDAIATESSFPNEIADSLKNQTIMIVDVGALELEGQSDLYAPLYGQCSCKVIGFDPQIGEPMTKTRDGCVKTILPIAIGNGQTESFHSTEYPGASSTLKPNRALLEQFVALPAMLAVRQVSEIKTRKLDEIEEVSGCDLLKIDVQGGELGVLKGALNLLQSVSIVLTEVEFAAVYENQPLFADVDTFLRDQGFFLQDLKNPGYSAYKAGVFDDSKARLLWTDAVYVKEPWMMERLDPKKILKAAQMAHVLLRNPGLAAFILGVFDRKTGNSFSNVYRLQLNSLRNAFENVRVPRSSQEDNGPCSGSGLSATL